ncbi:MAG TPA: hypothetical protein VM141_00480 [Planctomycetota bacterium]|nr:hypothetical protein [Planctomycetota bacterium]
MKNADGDRCAFEYTFYTRMPTNCLHTHPPPKIVLCRHCLDNAMAAAARSSLRVETGTGCKKRLILAARCDKLDW